MGAAVAKAVAGLERAHGIGEGAAARDDEPGRIPGRRERLEPGAEMGGGDEAAAELDEPQTRRSLMAGRSRKTASAMSHRLHSLLAAPPPWILGVLNLTPDSFSDGGRFGDPESAIAAARAMMREGAAAVDVGGESTAPGRKPVDAATELARIEPVVRALAPEMPLSIDTYHAATAARCLELGARIINDVSALRADPAMVEVVAGSEAALILMHAKDAPLPHVSPRPARYRDVVEEVAAFLLERADFAVRRGIAAERIILDPGWSAFLSHDPEDSWRLLAAFDRFVARVAPFPVMVAVSRKGLLKVPMEERDPLSQLLALFALEAGAALVRTHHVRMMRQFLEAAAKCGRRPAAAG